MIWFKKIIRAILNLLPLLFLTLIPFNVSASSHRYNTIMLAPMEFPSPVVNSSLGHAEINYNDVQSWSGLGGDFLLRAENSAYNSSYDSIYLTHSMSWLNAYVDSSDPTQCVYNDVKPLFLFNKSNNQFQVGTFSPSGGSWLSIVNDNVNSSYSTARCRYGHKFGEGKNLSFKSSSIPAGLLSCNDSNGAVCGGLWNTSEYINSQILPYPYTSNAFYNYGSVEVNGITYSHSFSPLKEMFNGDINRFSYLSIPLADYSDYWLNSDNFSNGRQIDINATIFSNNSFDFNPDFSSASGSSSRGVFLKYSGYDYYSARFIEDRVRCSVENVHVGGVGDNSNYFPYELRISCNLNLPTKFITFSPTLVFDGDHEYIFDNSDWSFSYGSFYYITDGDSTPSYDFGTTNVNGTYIFGDPAHYIPDNNSDGGFIANIVNLLENFRVNILNLFQFNFLNPFAPLFALFTSGDECVNIPIMASMLNSDENVVCPWFPASVRNIVTPVFMLVSVMIIFGFAVRWVKSSSSDFSPVSPNGKGKGH